MSRFIQDTSDYRWDESPVINFDDAIRLPGAGSTCDIYRTRWQRRDVFVKRLKEEYRSKPLYLDALDKEFDIGVRLSHPSLPEYREFHRDYIVMDYIDGQTLAEMLRCKDPWLAKEKNIRRLLTELIDVTDYLHRHGVVHCDIKPDNIIITSNNKDLVLLDFDKSYTDALNDTSGHPGRYGLPMEEAGRVEIDFRAIAMLLERLKEDIPGFKFAAYKKFLIACHRPDVNCEVLREILAGSHHPAYVPRIMVGLFAFCIVIGLSVYFVKRSTPHAEKNLTSISKSTIVTNPVDTPMLTKSVISKPTPSKPGELTEEEIHNEARRRAAILDQRIQPAFNELLAGLDRLNALRSDGSLSGEQLLDSVRQHGDRADEYIKEAFEILKERFPNVTDREAWRIMSYSKAYTGYTRRATPELEAIGHEIEHRYATEGRDLKR